MKQRFISDEFFAGALWGFGMAVMVALFLNRSPDGKFHGSQIPAFIFGMFCISIGSSLYGLVRHRRRLKLRVPEKPEGPPAQ